MIYLFKDKIYCKPLSNKIAPVKVITNSKGEYMIKQDGDLIYITEKDKKELKPIDLKQAYQRMNVQKEKATNKIKSKFKIED